jgi:hypothetical protein
MEQQLIRQIKALQIYAAVLTIAVLLLAIMFLRLAYGTPHFKQIDAGRINIVEDDGQLRMVMSNQKLQHPGRMDGKDFSPRDRSAGMIFFNDDGDECGGLVFDGNKKESGMVYSFDQYKNDQVMQLQYQQDSPLIRSYGLKMWDESDKFPLGPIMRADDSLRRLHDTAALNAYVRKLQSEGYGQLERLFLGKTKQKNVGLFLRDSKGQVRLRIGIDSLDHVFFQALDEKGNPTPLNPTPGS